MTLSNKLTAGQWKQLFRLLMMTTSGNSINVEAEISFIETKDPRDLREQIHKSLNTWVQKCGKNATKRTLCDSLRKVGLPFLADEIGEICHRSSGKETSVGDRPSRSSDGVLETDV